MTNEDLQNIHNNLYEKYIIDPENLEKEISEVADIAATRVTRGYGVISFQFKDNTFIARLAEDLKGFRRVIQLVVSNENSRAIAGNRYIPYTVEAEVDNNLSAKENYRTVFEAFLRHVCGAVQPEILEE